MKSPWNHRHFGAILLCSLQKQFTEIHELGRPRWGKSGQRAKVSSAPPSGVVSYNGSPGVLQMAPARIQPRAGAIFRLDIRNRELGQ
jgi:hypothetical protein